MSRLAFRNLEITPEAPVHEWPLEAVRTVLERGTLQDWRRLAAEVRRDPWGSTARTIEEILAHSRPYGVAPLMEGLIVECRDETERSEREQVAQEIVALIEKSGLPRAEFARRIGTSSSRLSTYATGKVTPSASMMVRMRRVASGAERKRG